VGTVDEPDPRIFSVVGGPFDDKYRDASVFMTIFAIRKRTGKKFTSSFTTGCGPKELTLLKPVDVRGRL
jgi:hypothetical protein